MSDIAPWVIAFCILATAILTIWILTARRIPKSKQKSLLRRISAKADVDYAVNAYEQFKAIEVKDLRYNLFLAMVVAYAGVSKAKGGAGSNASRGLTAGHVDPDKLCHAPCLQWKPVQALCAWICFKCALSEEPGAVIPHAGICEGGVG